MITERTTCRISEGPLVNVWDLGELPLSCFPMPGDGEPPRFPLTLALNKHSGLVQLRHTIDPNILYQHYWYLSGINQTMQLALKDIVLEAMQRLSRGLDSGAIVVDIGCNDGTLLSNYPNDITRVGFDPAKNIVPQSCDQFINTYFSADAYRSSLGERKASIVTSISMFYDLENPIRFATDVAEILHPEGIWIIELSYLPSMLHTFSFDTICAEHLEYYSLTSIEYILQKAKLEIEDVAFNAVNGGSFRLYVRHASKAQMTPRVEETRAKELLMHLCEEETYYRFAKAIHQNKQEMLAFLQLQKQAGKTVLGYGASTKGNTIMAYYGIGPELISHVADRNPTKWGRQTVTRIPIISEEEARRMQPDYFLAFPYHFMDEFMQREQAFRIRGGKFISPVPRLGIL
jgi:hypothetical protein